MKKVIFISFVLSVMGMTLTCCFGNRKSAEELRADSIARADSLQRVQAAQDSMKHAIAVEEWNNFTSNDLRTFFLKGHVKEAIMKRDEYVSEIVRFSRDGELTYYSKGNDMKWTFSRDKKGRLIRITHCADYYITLEYDKEGHLITFDTEGDNEYFEMMGATYYTRFESDLPVSGSEGGLDGGVNCSWAYEKYDDHLNWTQRNLFRKWSESMGYEDDQITETQIIKYYKMDE